jgi:hypothetical protein
VFMPLWIIQHRLLSFRVLSHELCFLAVQKPLQARNEWEVPHNFMRRFLPFLVSISIAQRTFGLGLMLITIHDAVIDARVDFFVR